MGSLPTSEPTVAAHKTVNHSLNFVDPVSGTPTQHVESYWSRAKHKIKRMKGCHAHQLTSSLDEFMWRESYGRTAHQASSWLILLNSILYDCVSVITIQTVQLHHTCHTICYHHWEFVYTSVSKHSYELEFVSARSNSGQADC